MGFINHKKGPQLLLECFDRIYNYDPTFEFHIAGSHQEERVHLWFQAVEPKLPYKIHWDGWIEDINEYYADKDFVINTSLFESQCLALQEGMSAGVIPLVHNWLGANNIYPTNFLFNTAEDCLDLVKRVDGDQG